MPATLHLDLGREMRGGQWQALYLISELTAAGHRCALLARAGSPLLERAVVAGVDARPFRMRELMKTAPEFDLIHAHDARSHTFAAFLKRPLIVSRRVAFRIESSFASRWKYTRASRYIAVSRFVGRGLMESGVTESRIDVVYDGVRLPAEGAASRSLVVALDSDDPGKGKALLKVAAGRGKIDLHFSKDLAADLPRAKLFVYVTESEGLGSAALLAMAHGVPVLASAVGGLPEIVEEGNTGMLIHNNSADTIADGMVKMLQDDALLATLGSNARLRVERDFTTDHMMQRTLQVYEKVLG